jgi:hypothetical protein
LRFQIQLGRLIRELLVEDGVEIEGAELKIPGEDMLADQITRITIVVHGFLHGRWSRSIVWRELDLHFEYLRVLHTGLLWWESTFSSPETSIPGCHSEQSSQKLSDSSPTYGEAVEIGVSSLFLDDNRNSSAYQHIPPMDVTIQSIPITNGDTQQSN